MKSVLILQRDLYSVDNRVLTFSNSRSDSELIWLYKCSQLPRDLDTGTWDISISLMDVILITLNCFDFVLWIYMFFSSPVDAKRDSQKVILLYSISYLLRPQVSGKTWRSMVKRME